MDMDLSSSEEKNRKGKSPHPLVTGQLTLQLVLSLSILAMAIYLTVLVGRVSTDVEKLKTPTDAPMYNLTNCTKVCPDEIGWMSGGDSCYRISTIAMNWHEAKLFCMLKMNGHMVEVTSAEETKIIKEMVANNPNSNDPVYWLGLQDVAVHGQWVWDHSRTKIDSTSYTNWQPTQPDFLRQEHCAVLCHVGQWCDYHCHMRKADGKYNILALCETPKECLQT